MLFFSLFLSKLCPFPVIRWNIFCSSVKLAFISTAAQNSSAALGLRGASPAPATAVPRPVLAAGLPSADAGVMPHPCSRLTRLLRGAWSQSGGAEVSTGDLAVCRWGAQRQAGAEDGERRLAGRGHFLPPASHLRGPSASEGGPVGPWPGLGAGRGGDSSLGHRWNPPHVSSQVEARATHRGGSRFCPGSQGPVLLPMDSGSPPGLQG